MSDTTYTGPKIAIIFYSLYGHIAQLAAAEKAGIVKAGGKADVFQVEETLSADILKKMGAPPKGNIPTIKPEQLADYDAILLGVPTRYGNMPGQWKAFWDATGQLWAAGKLAGKYVGLFVSSGTQGGGQESTALAMMSTFAHHGLVYVPLGYSRTFTHFADDSHAHGGSPWGAGTFAGATGSRQPTVSELEVATIQGEYFYDIVKKVSF